MFGLFDLKFFISLCLLTAATALAAGPPSTQKKAVFKGKVINDSAIVYQNADFDSPVLGYLAAGKVYEISSKTFGPFYRIRVEGKVGYIADNDIRPVNFKPADPLGKEKDKKVDSPRSRKKRPYALSRFVGPAYASINYMEETMGAKRTEALSFFGAKISGTDVLFEGDVNTEINLMFFVGAPNYYEKLTGQGTGGFIFHSDFQLQSVSTLTQNMIGFFGFGPMFRFSKFDLSLKEGYPNPAPNAKVVNYKAENAALGIVLSAGFGVRWGSVALRSEGKYYWEKNPYWSLGGALQFEF